LEPVHFDEPVDAIAFEMLQQWHRDKTKQFVFGVMHNGELELFVPAPSSHLSAAFIETAEKGALSASKSEQGINCYALHYISTSVMSRLCTMNED